MRSGVLAFVAVTLVAPAAAAQQSPGVGSSAQPAPTTTQQLGLAVDYLMMLYAMQAMASSPPIPQAQAEAMVHQYFTNGAQATAVPTSGPGAAYFNNAGEALAQVTMDVGNAPRGAPDGGAASATPGAAPTTTATAQAPGVTAPQGTGGAANAAPTATSTLASGATATPTATEKTTAAPTATATPTPTATPTGVATPTTTGVSPTAPATANPVTIVEPVTVPVPQPAAAPQPQVAVPRTSGAAWAGVFAAGAALGALLVVIGSWLRPPRRTAV